MLIGELSKRCGLSRDTIRFYEKHGLIEIGKKERRFNNYKEYSEEILNRLLTVKKLKGFGFTLNEILDMLDMIEANEATCGNVASKITGKIKILDEKIQELNQLKEMLLNGVGLCEGGCNPVRPENNCSMLLP